MIREVCPWGDAMDLDGKEKCAIIMDALPGYITRLR